jgi:hypothetical protein
MVQPPPATTSYAPGAVREIPSSISDRRLRGARRSERGVALARLPGSRRENPPSLLFAQSQSSSCPSPLLPHEARRAFPPRGVSRPPRRRQPTSPSRGHPRSRGSRAPVPPREMASCIRNRRPGRRVRGYPTSTPRRASSVKARGTVPSLAAVEWVRTANSFFRVPPRTAQRRARRRASERRAGLRARPRRKRHEAGASTCPRHGSGPPPPGSRARFCGRHGRPRGSRASRGRAT